MSSAKTPIRDGEEIMDRRSLLKTGFGAGLGLVGATTVSAPALAQGLQELKMVTSWPKNFPGLGTAAQRFADRIDAASDGRYKIKVFGGGELVAPLKCNDAVQEGTADLYHSTDYYYGGKSKAYPFFTSVPFGFTANEINAWLQHGGGQELWDEVGANFGIKHLSGGNTGVQMLGWFRNELTSVDDLKGLKMRMPGFGGDVINALGGSSVTLAGSEILTALQSGAIDATEWVGPWNDLAFGFHKVTKHYYSPGFQEPGSNFSIGIATKFWDSIPVSDRALFEAVAAETNYWSIGQFNANNASALQTLITKHGVQVHDVPADIFRAFGEASADVVASAAAADPLAAKVYESYSAFKKNVTDWSARSDQAYMTERSKA